MEKTWKPKVAGILCIVTGAIGVLSGTAVILHGETFYSFGFLIMVPLVALMSIAGGYPRTEKREVAIGAGRVYLHAHSRDPHGLPGSNGTHTGELDGRRCGVLPDIFTHCFWRCLHYSRDPRYHV